MTSRVVLNVQKKEIKKYVIAVEEMLPSMRIKMNVSVKKDNTPTMIELNSVSVKNNSFFKF